MEALISRVDGNLHLVGTGDLDRLAKLNALAVDLNVEGSALIASTIMAAVTEPKRTPSSPTLASTATFWPSSKP